MNVLSWWDYLVLTGSCPNLMMSRSEAVEQKISQEAASRSQSALKTHRSLCFSLSSDGARQYKGLVCQDNLLAQVSDGLGLGKSVISHYHRVRYLSLFGNICIK